MIKIQELFKHLDTIFEKVGNVKRCRYFIFEGIGKTTTTRQSNPSILCVAILLA